MENLPRVTRADVRNGSAVLTAIGVAYTWDALRLPLGDPFGTGSGSVPVIVGLLWVACGAYLTVWPPEITRHDEEVGTWPDRDMVIRFAMVLGLCFGFIFFLPKLGIVVTSAIFMMLIARIADASWPKAVVSSLFLAAALWVVFVYFLGLPLPPGTWTTSIWQS